MPVPIWKDTIYTAVTDAFDYRLLWGGQTLCEGTASPYPDGVVRISLNELTEQFLNNDLPDYYVIAENSTYNAPDALKTVFLYSGDELLMSRSFIYDWSYDTYRDILSEPINGHLDPRMKIMYTAYRASAGQICIV